jgi:uncharacterized protein (DUF1684 family)
MAMIRRSCPLVMTLFMSATLLVACHGPLPSTELDWRHQREKAVREELPADKRATFGGLRFFPYDPSYRFRAMIEPVVPPEPVRMAAADGSVRPAHRIGRVRLRFPGGDATLSIYQLDDLTQSYPDMLFLPFRDSAAGKQTYGAGRYVDIERMAGGVVQIDFNRAYNPDCAYGISGQCPITPEENTLHFEVKAGEMMPEIAGH